MRPDRVSHLFENPLGNLIDSDKFRRTRQFKEALLFPDYIERSRRLGHVLGESFCEWGLQAQMIRAICHVGLLGEQMGNFHLPILA